MSAPGIEQTARFRQNEVCKFAERKLVKPDFTAALAATMQLASFQQGKLGAAEEE